MFVRILRETDAGTFDSLYECRRFHIRPHDGQLMGDAFEITMEGEEGNAITVAIDKNEGKVALYAMNERGRTVDTIFNNRG